MNSPASTVPDRQHFQLNIGSWRHPMAPTFTRIARNRSGARGALFRAPRGVWEGLAGLGGPVGGAASTMWTAHILGLIRSPA